jgi:DUF971 family protein
MADSLKYQIASIQPVGRYALGVTWQDKHDSIYPFGNLRRFCRCDDCRRTSAVEHTPSEDAQKLTGVHRLQQASVMLHWADGHESLYLVEELRELCGCAACKGEPEYPITGR